MVRRQNLFSSKSEFQIKVKYYIHPSFFQFTTIEVLTCNNLGSERTVGMTLETAK